MISKRSCKKIVTFSGVALLCGATAFAQSSADNTQNGGTSTGGQSGASMSSGSSGKASAADKAFARKALQDGMAEVQLGQLASDKGGSDDVKQFGQKMVTDHTRLGDQMKPIAQQMGVNPPAGPSAKDQALMTKLQGMSGKQFDNTYIKAMVKDHRTDLKEFSKEARSAKDPALKDAASQGKQVIQQHLQMAEQLAQAHHVAVGGSGGSGADAGSGTSGGTGAGGAGGSGSGAGGAQQ